MVGRPRVDGSVVYNQTSDFALDTASAEDFISDISDALKAGFGFVPFVGAGLSAPAGMPLVREILPYLQRCIALALSLESNGLRPWNPRSDQWPSMVDRRHLNLSDDYWPSLVAQELRRLERVEPNSPRRWIYHEAFGAMAEWRTALAFLSRLVRETVGEGYQAKESLYLDAPEQQVVDSCIVEMMKGRQPTLAHRMLASLGGLLRLDILLTTNFDDLLERAFSIARNPLTTFETHLQSHLPHWSALCNQRSLIKMHGNRHSVRVDYSLDAPPSETDRWRFLEYLLSAKGRRDLRENLATRTLSGLLEPENHILVMGFSAADRRIRSFIEQAWLYLDASKFKVFWICFTPEDVSSVVEFTRDFQRRVRTQKPHIGNSDWLGSCIVRHTDVGLLLLHILQRLRCWLPSQGLVFPTTATIPSPPLRPQDVSSDSTYIKNSAELRERLLRIVETFTKPEYFRRSHRILAVAARAGDVNTRGVTTVCAEVFSKCEKDFICLWLDMDDIHNATDLFEKLLDAVHHKLGMESWLPLALGPRTRDRVAAIRKLTHSTKKPWLFFLNAREEPGSRSRSKLPDPRLINGWLDEENPVLDNKKDDFFSPAAGADDHTATQAHFQELVAELGGPESKNISIVILCKEPVGDGHSVLTRNLTNSRMIDDVELPHGPCGEFSEEVVVESAINWCEGVTDKTGFLLRLVLMERTRYLAAIWHFDLLPPVSDDVVHRWLQELEKGRLIRRKLGGFIWLHVECRQQLKSKLEALVGQDGLVRANDNLSEWYERVALSSQAPEAVFEAVLHACRSASTCLDGSTASIEMAVERINRAHYLLKCNSFLIQTHGYARISDRAMEMIRFQHCSALRQFAAASKDARYFHSAVNRLEIQCLEVMRATDREVSENSVAYRRHKSIRILICNGDNSGSKPDAKVTDKDLFRVLVGSQISAGRMLVSSSLSVFLRWHRWSAMLAINSRSYISATSAISRAISAIHALLEAPVDETASGLAQSYSRKHISTKLGLFENGNMIDTIRVVAAKLLDPTSALDRHVYVEFTRIVEQLILVSLLQLATKRRTNEARWIINDTAGSELLHIVPHVETLCNEALATIDRFATTSDIFDRQLVDQLMWCKSRVFMHLSMVEMAETDKLRNPEFCYRQSQKAMRLLLKAEATSNSIDDSSHAGDQALIELYRAEVRIREACFVSVEANRTFLDFIMTSSKVEPPRNWRVPGPNFHVDHLGSDYAEGFAKAKSLVEDALRFLSRAAPILKARRQNVWWSSWLLDRQLRAISMAVWATAPERRTPIPFLGIEAAPRYSATQADVILDEASQIVRSDTFRMASILDSYVSCANALKMRLLLDADHEDMVPLPERQIDMFAKIEIAKGQLQSAVDERNERGEVDKNAIIDPLVKDFVVAVKDRSGLENSIGTPLH